MKSRRPVNSDVRLLLSVAGTNMYTDEASQLERLEFSFAEMRDAGWDLDGDLLWGYFFVDADVSKLNALGEHLESLDYRFVDILELENENKEPSGKYILHVDRVEIHRPDTLAKRNVALSQVASQYDVSSYDGWDAGQVELPPQSNKALQLTAR